MYSAGIYRSLNNVLNLRDSNKSLHSEKQK